MTDAVATRWANTVVPSWLYRWLMPLGWIVAVVVTVSSDGSRCTPGDRCGVLGSLAMVACYASLVLCWWQPRLAAFAGLVFLAFELNYGDAVGALVAWSLYAGACALFLAWLTYTRHRQSALTVNLPTQQVAIPAAARVGVTSRLVIAGVLALAGAAALAAGWYTVAGGAWLLTILFVLRDLQLRRTRVRRSRTEAGLPVRIDPDASGSFAIRSTEGDVLLGFLRVALDDREADERLSSAIDLLNEAEDDLTASMRLDSVRTLRQYRGEAVLVGDLAEGSWPTILIGDTPLRPVSGLRTPRRTPWSVETGDRLDLEVHEMAGRPAGLIDPVREIPTLPWSVPIEPAQAWCRPVLVAALLAGPAAVGLFTSWGDWFPVIVAVVAGALLIRFTTEELFYAVVASATELRIRRSPLERVVGWQAVESIEVNGDRVTLRTDGGSQVVGGVAKGQAGEVAAVFEALRAQTDAPAAGPRLTPQLVIEAVYYVACAVAFLVLL
ncbi:hypothetical protein EV646_103562 [Kribbella antiqua]|uniref:Uncharacterized protein n=1 Tax=Kribbella antiqua TaxID=2512217 RepID=A0A4V2S4U1_9ACTN|nr:hypothetical protein [Kribbella antiqua]TCO49580.1 hypothetical protein EV646_103562 [Kribbella antiqua]